MASEPSQSLYELIETFLKSNPSVPRPDKTESELEVKFGTQGIRPVTRIDYDNVINELYNHGFTTSNVNGKTFMRIQSEYADPKSGRTKISNVRCVISSIEAIQQYCKSNSLESIPDYALSFEQKMDVQREDKSYFRPADNKDFNFRTTLKYEKPIGRQSPSIRDLIMDWSNKKKIFRFINRVSFIHESLPITIELSIVKSSHRAREYTIPEYTIEASKVFDDIENYEIELEVINFKTGSGTPWTSENSHEFTAMLKNNIKVILSGMQQTHYPVSYPEQYDVSQSYMRVINKGSDSRKIMPRDFIGPSSMTLQISNIGPINEDATIPNIRTDYTVTEKADGLRKILYINHVGKVYLIDTNMQVQFTGAVSKNDELFETILDGEHILHDKHGEFINLYAAFDVYFVNKKDVRANSFIPNSNDVTQVKYRFPLMQKVVSKLSLESIVPGQASPIMVEHKKFYESNSSQSIFDACKLILERSSSGLFKYETDGLIFTPSFLGVGANKSGDDPKNYKATWNHSFKWKPPQYNTIDFLISVKQTTSGDDYVGNIFEEGVDTGSHQQLTEYKTITLRCGFDEKKHGYLNPCQNVIEDKLPSVDSDIISTYQPMPFYPTNPYDTNAHVCNIIVQRDSSGGLQMQTEEGEVFTNNTIVEFKYHPEKEVGWRWTPIKVRYDKTTELRRGFKNYGNAYHVANSNWHSIHNPVLDSMLKTGQNIPEEMEDEDVYYNKLEGASKTKALRDFHNLFVKRSLILGTSKFGNTLIDVAVGKAGDFPKWIASKLSFVFGLDISKDNIENRLDGACARYLNYRKKFKTMPHALFVQGNSSVNIRSGAALFTEKGKQITNAIFGQGPKDAENLGEGVYRQYGKAINGFNIASCQFALHYFFESPAILNSFIRNISECTAVDGYFIGCCYDGKKIFNALSKKEIGSSITIMKGDTRIWEMTKEYNQTSFENNVSCVGYPINVFQETIGKSFREYLVNFDYFTRIMENYGFILPSAEEVSNLHLPNATGSFSELFTKMENTAKTTKLRLEVGQALNMSSEEKQISFYNRYFVFKKVRNVDAEKLSLSSIDETTVEEARMEVQSELATESVKAAILESKTEKKTKRKKRTLASEVVPTEVVPTIAPEAVLTPAPEEVPTIAPEVVPTIAPEVVPTIAPDTIPVPSAVKRRKPKPLITMKESALASEPGAGMNDTILIPATESVVGAPPIVETVPATAPATTKVKRIKKPSLKPAK